MIDFLKLENIDRRERALFFHSSIDENEIENKEILPAILSTIDERFPTKWKEIQEVFSI